MVIDPTTTCAAGVRDAVRAGGRVGGRERERGEKTERERERERESCLLYTSDAADER